ncbi:MAG: M1 family peptidase, partial [Bacteroidota bacterium]
MKNCRWLFLALLLTFLSTITFAQEDFYKGYQFTKADTLRGMLRPERTCFDVNHYTIDLDVDMAERSLNGFVDIRFLVKEKTEKIQLDLWRNMNIDSVTWRGKTLQYERIEDAFFVDFPESLEVGAVEKVTVNYHGKPHVAKMAPWDGGFVWSKDENGNPWVG